MVNLESVSNFSDFSFIGEHYSKPARSRWLSSSTAIAFSARIIARAGYRYVGLLDHHFLPEVAKSEPEIGPFILDGADKDIAPGVHIQ